MQFQIPQYIDVEDKIFGPLTLKQFIYLAGGGGLVFLIYKAMPLYFGIFLIAPVVGLSGALAFYKINNKPFIEVVEAGFKYFMSTRLYLWKKREPKLEKKIKKKKAEELEPQIKLPKLSKSKLKDIAWSLDVEESIGAEEGK